MFLCCFLHNKRWQWWWWVLTYVPFAGILKFVTYVCSGERFFYLRRLDIRCCCIEFVDMSWNGLSCANVLSYAVTKLLTQSLLWAGRSTVWENDNGSWSSGTINSVKYFVFFNLYLFCGCCACCYLDCWIFCLNLNVVITLLISHVIMPFTRAALQNPDSQIWKAGISISTKLKLYNTCILPIFLYGSCTENDVCVWRYTVIVVHARNEWENEWMIVSECKFEFGLH